MLRRNIIVLALLAVCTAPAAATTDGICYQMRDVPPGEPLNLRAGPSSKARLVLPVYSGIIAKVGRCSSGWCNVAVSTGDGTMRGWMNRRYLRQSECP